MELGSSLKETIQVRPSHVFRNKMLLAIEDVYEETLLKRISSFTWDAVNRELDIFEQCHFWFIRMGRKWN